MTRILVHVEGETEETFVNEVLRPYLLSAGFEDVSARLLGNARARSRRGGIRSWSIVKSDILRHLASDPGCIATTMVDYYALPSSPPSSWPGRATAPQFPLNERGRHVEEALNLDISSSPYANRFEPFVLMHEFEALLFSDCEAFANAIGYPREANKFSAISQQFANPEEINDSPVTAPSKRVTAIISNYEKPLLGTLAAIEIGIDKMRLECPHFASWLARLETRVQI